MTTPDFPDWVKSVDTREVSVTLLNQDLAVGVDAPVLDTSAFQSVAVRFSTPTIGGAAGDLYFLSMQWQTGGATTVHDGISRHDQASYVNNNAGQVFTDLPVRGQSVQVQVFGPAGKSAPVRVTGSTRPVQVSSLSVQGGVGMGFRSRLDTGNVIIPATSTSGRFYIPPVLSRLALQSDSVLAAVHYQLDAATYGGGFGTVVTPMATANGDGVTLTRAVLDIAKLASELTIVNTSAGAVTVRVRAWDAS